MARPELGTKRTCPETDRKFYDLGKDPVVSPYTGKSYPLSFFEEIAQPAPVAARKKADADKPDVDADEVEADVEVDTDEADVVSLEDADEDTSGTDKAVPDLGDNTDDDIDLDDDDDDDDTFLADDDEDDGDDVTGIIDVAGGDDDDS